MGRMSLFELGNFELDYMLLIYQLDCDAFCCDLVNIITNTQFGISEL